MFAPAATLEAQALRHVWIVFCITGFAVAVVVYSLILWCIVRYRRPAGDVEFPRQFRRNNTLEIVYTAIPIVMVCLLFALTYAVEHRVEAVDANPNVVIHVTGFRWSWMFDYPQFGIHIGGTPDRIPIFAIPQGKSVRLVTSTDVDHSFWIPAFFFKRDAIPGMHTLFEITPQRLGLFRGECGEYCGLRHAQMGFAVRVMTTTAFANWVKTQRHRNASTVQSS